MDDIFTYSLNHIRIDRDTTKKELLNMLKQHDKDSFNFSFTTSLFNYSIASEYKSFTPDKLRLFFECGMFHDIGKIGMPYEFINFPGKYTVKMFEEMKKHTTGGKSILNQTDTVEKEIRDTAGYHHCNFDGTGYPGGKVGDEIPFVARLTRISDSADAYLSNRCYKSGGPARETFEDLNNYKGTSYDPEIMDAFEVVHFNIMDECHRQGEDRPSKSLYIHFLKELYLKNFVFRSKEQLLSGI